MATKLIFIHAKWLQEMISFVFCHLRAKWCAICRCDWTVSLWQSLIYTSWWSNSSRVSTTTLVRFMSTDSTVISFSSQFLPFFRFSFCEWNTSVLKHVEIGSLTVTAAITGHAKLVFFNFRFTFLSKSNQSVIRSEYLPSASQLSIARRNMNLLNYIRNTMAYGRQGQYYCCVSLSGTRLSTFL